MISVVLPVYNREETVGEAIKSVLKQTIKDIELIVVDDCSSDNTREVIQRIKDKRLKYYRLNKNSGACVARNYGIEKSSGEYIAFQDSDDEWKEDKLAKQLECLKETKADLVFCGLEVYENNVFRKKSPRFLKKSQFVTYKYLLEDPIVSTQALIGKRECFNEIMFDPEMPRFQDWDISLRLSQRFTVYFLADTLVRLNVQSDSISKNNEKGKVALEKIFLKNKDEIEKSQKAYANYYIMLADLTGDKRYLMKALKRSKSFKNILRVGRGIAR